MSESPKGGAPVLKSHVHGTLVPESGPVEMRSPGNPDEVVSLVRPADARLAETAVTVAAEAASSWASTSPVARAKALERAAGLIDERTEAIALDLARETGKSIAEARAETGRSADLLRYAAAQAGLEPDGATFPSGDPENFLFARREPVGPVAVITPWNFPIAIPAWKIAPALAFGNTVVWKPSDISPLTADHLLAALLEGGVAPDAVSMLQGDGALIGPVITTAPAIEAVTFTGSNAVGGILRRTVGPLGKRLQLEMGGKNASVVLADADLEEAAAAIARAAFLSTGQKCTATSRVIVESAVAPELVERLAAHADSMKVGDPLDPDFDVGPLSSEAHAERVRTHLAQGMAEGTLASRRGQDEVPPGPYVAPAVLVDLPEESGLLREEIFGPVIAVIEVDSADEAIDVANATPFGLSASIFTRDLAQAMKFARRLEVGNVKVNQESTGNAVNLPFGGMGESSHGPAEQGKAAVEFFTKWKSVYVRGVT